LLRLLWLVVIPLLAAGVASRHLVPHAQNPDGQGLLSAAARLAQERPVEVGVAFFLAFAAMLHYWRFYLPGGRFLAKLPLEVAAKAPRAALAELESAARIERLLAKSVARSGAPHRERLRGDLKRLRAALERADAAAASSASRVLVEQSRASLRTRQLLQLGAFAVSMLLAVFGAQFVRANWLLYRVLSSSMVPSFQVNDVLIGSRSPEGLTAAPFAPAKPRSMPRRGDIIVFRDTTGAGPEYLIKRVIGLPGDEIIMNSGRPFINRWAVPKCDAGRYANVIPGGGYVDGRLVVEFLDGNAYLTMHAPMRKQSSPYVVKPGEVFVLGDNRNSSLDSRAWHEHGGSGVPVSEIVARVDRSLFHTSRSGRAAWDTLLEPAQRMSLNLDGLDDSVLREGIRRCLASAPKDTKPPVLDSSEPLPSGFPQAATPPP
jgi:signal peptidase I